VPFVAICKPIINSTASIISTISPIPAQPMIITLVWALRALWLRAASNATCPATMLSYRSPSPLSCIRPRIEPVCALSYSANSFFVRTGAVLSGASSGISVHSL
jgi:hypothetical protein